MYCRNVWSIMNNKLKEGRTASSVGGAVFG